MKMRSLQVLSIAWRRHRRKVGLTGVHPLDTPSSSPPTSSTSTASSTTSTSIALDPLEQGAAYLRQYWSQVFAKGRSFQMAIDHLLNYIPDFAMDYNWAVSQADIEYVLNFPKKSAPGPDGIPYGALCLLGPAFAEVLHNIFIDSTMDFTSTPFNFNQAIMTFLPKGEDETDTIISKCRHAPRTRPLTLSNTDSKVLSSVINNKLAAVLPTMTLPIQRGFVKSRFILDNILELEGIGLSAVASSEESVALIAFDVRLHIQVCHTTTYGKFSTSTPSPRPSSMP